MPVTPCPDIDRLVDDAAAGVPGAAGRLDAHAASCAACAAEAEALDDGFGDAFACLREETCPPEVLAAVFAEVGARTRPAPPRAPDRDARPTARPARRRVWAGALTAAALVALVMFWPRTEAPLVAVATPAVPTETRPVEMPPVETQPAESQSTEAQPAMAHVVTEPASTRRSVRTALRRARRRADAPRASTPHDDAPAPAERLDLPNESNIAETPTPADAAAARDELLLALRIVARAQRSADAAVQTEMQRVSSALEPAQLIQ